MPSGVVMGTGGEIYGTTAVGGALPACNGGGCGTIFRLMPPSAPGKPWTKQTLYSFAGPPNDGAAPLAGLLVGGDGSLYGTTSGGGPGGYGTVFQLTPPSVSGAEWNEAILYSFGGPGDAAQPMGLTFGSKGEIYGIATGIRSGPPGAAFELTPPSAPGAPWKQTILHTLQDLPNGALVQGRNGVLYGTSYRGGKLCGFRGSTCGTIFALAPPASPGVWRKIVLHEFTGRNGDGGRPYGGLVIGKGGLLYGTTSCQKPNHAGGTVFELKR
jgi:uncharacterized repeat protein (TIGR03803 family)